MASASFEEVNHKVTSEFMPNSFSSLLAEWQDISVPFLITVQPEINNHSASGECDLHLCVCERKPVFGSPLMSNTTSSVLNE